MTDQGRSPAPPPFTWEAPASAAPSASAPMGNQPMSSGAIFDRAMWVYRSGFLVLLGVAAVVQVPVAILDAIIGRRVDAAVEQITRSIGQPTSEELSKLLQDSMPAILSAGLTIGLVSFIAGLFLSPALIATIARVHRGEPASIGDAYAAALGNVLSILVGSLVTAIAAALLFLAFLVGGALIAAATNDGGIAATAVLLGVIVGIVAAVYVNIRWAVWAQAVVIERRGPLDGLSRSWGLVGGSMWRTLAILFVTGVLTSIVGIIISAIGGAVGSPFGSWGSVVPSVLAIITASWVPIVTTLLFFDLRARHDGPAMAVATPVPAAALPEASWPTTPTPSPPGPPAGQPGMPPSVDPGTPPAEAPGPSDEPAPPSEGPGPIS